MKRRTLSMRSRTELMFQVAIVSAMAERGCGLGDGDGEIGQTVDMTFHLVAPDHGRDAGRRAGINQVARAELDIGREIGDRLGDVPNELRDIALLLDDTVDLEPDRTLGDVTDYGYRRDRRARCRLIKAFAEI